MCDDFFDDDGFWDLDSEDLFLLAGTYGYAREECEERNRIEREMEEEEQNEDEDYEKLIP